MEHPIITALEKKKSKIRFHMPGHKGKLKVLGKYPFSFDYTEVDGLDNLLFPQGAIARSQNLWAKEIGADAVFYSVNGSSAGILAAVLATVKQDEEIIVGRDAHVSALNALYLSGATPRYVEYSCIFGERLAPLDEKDVLEAIRKYPKAKAVLLNYINYHGICIKAQHIVEAAHELGMTVIFDAAHGAHLPYSDKLPKDAGAAGADIWITSAHKTLPAANQCALVCAKNNSRVDLEKLKESLNIVQTTSPSYLLLASLDFAREFMACKGKQTIERQLASIAELKEKVNRIEGMKMVDNDDPTRIVIDVRGRGITGFTAQEFLDKKGIGIECADTNHIILISTVVDTKKEFRKFVSTLASIPKGQKKEIGISATLESQWTLTPRQAEQRKWKTVLGSAAVGRIAAKNILVYPPGIPVLLAGQRIGEKDLLLIEKLEKKGYNLVEYQREIIVVEEENI